MVLSNIEAASSQFSLLFSSSSVFSRLALDLPIPANLTFHVQKVAVLTLDRNDRFFAKSLPFHRSALA